MWARPLGRRVTKPGRAEDRQSHKYFRYAAPGRPASVRWEDVKRLKGRERQNATGKRFLAEAELQRVALGEHGVQRALRLLRPSDPGCATVPRTIRDRVFGTRITTPAQMAGQSIIKRFNTFGAKKGFTDRNRGCTQSGMGGVRGPATPTGRSRTDPYSVTPLWADGASRCA